MKIILKQTLTVLFIAVMAFVFIPFTGNMNAYAGESLEPCGDNLSSAYSIDEIYVEVSDPNQSIESNKMYDYNNANDTPWASYGYIIEKVFVEFGVYSIGKNAFTANTGIQTVYLPSSLNSVGNNAFRDCEQLTRVYYGGTLEQWNALKAKIKKSTGNAPLVNATVYILNRGLERVDISGGSATYSGTKAKALSNTLDYMADHGWVLSQEEPVKAYDFDFDGYNDFYLDYKSATEFNVVKANSCGVQGMRIFNLEPDYYVSDSIYNTGKYFFNDVYFLFTDYSHGSFTIDMSDNTAKKFTGDKFYILSQTVYQGLWAGEMFSDSSPGSASYKLDIDRDQQYDVSVKKTDSSITFTPIYKGSSKTYTMSESSADLCQLDKEDFYSKLVFKFPIRTLTDTAAKVEKVASIKDYTGSAIKPTPRVWYDGKLLTKGTDYTLTYGANTKIGATGTVTVTGKGDYEGTVKQNFTIKGNLGNAATKVTTESIAKKTYNGSAWTPKPWVKAVLPGGTVGKLTNGTSYTLSYKNNVNVGKASLIITGKNKYRGTKTVNFTISPEGTTMKNIVPLSKGFRVTWNKQTVHTSGYDIIYSTKSDFSTYAIKTVSGNTNYIKSVTGLKGNTKYYVKIRTYKMVDGTKYLSKWSEAGSITTKA